MAIEEGMGHAGDSEEESGEESSGDESYDYGFVAGALFSRHGMHRRRGYAHLPLACTLTQTYVWRGEFVLRMVMEEKTRARTTTGARYVAQQQ